MGRASKEQAELNRGRIVEAACSLFRKHGVENVAIADLMNAAGLTPGGFYKHFASKEALIAEAFTLAFEQSKDVWSRTLNTNSSGAASGMQALAHQYFSQRSSQQNCPLLSFASQVSQQPLESKAVSEYEHGVQSLYREFHAGLDAACAHETAERSEAESMLLFSALVGAGMLSRAMGDSDWVKALQAAILEALPH